MKAKTNIIPSSKTARRRAFPPRMHGERVTRGLIQTGERGTGWKSKTIR